MPGSEKWAVRVKEFRESGKSQRTWCKEQGIKRSTLRYWLERIDELAQGEEVRFAKIAIGVERDDRH